MLSAEMFFQIFTLSPFLAVLNLLSIAIPSVLGTGSLVFIGRYAIQAIRMSVIESVQAFQGLKDMALTAGSVFLGGAKGFIQGVQMAGQASISSIDTSAVGATNTQRLVSVAGRTAKLLKTEGSHALVEFLDSGFQTWVHQRDYEPILEPQNRPQTSVQPQTSGFGEKLYRGVKGAINGTFNGYRKVPKSRSSIVVPI